MTTTTTNSVSVSWGLIKLICILLTLLGIFYLSNELATARKALTTTQGELATERETARLAGEKLAARDAIDKQRTEELNRALDQNQSLRRAVDDGSKRLLVKAVCRIPVPSPTGTTRVADAGIAELAADARPDYFTLRSELITTREMITGLQDYIRQVVQRTPAL